MRYEEAVLEFRQLDERIEDDRWRQAEIIFELVEGGNSRSQISRDLGYANNSRHIKTLYKVGASAPRFLADGRKFEEAYRMMETGADDPDDASQLKDRNRAASALSKLPADIKAEVIRQELANDDSGRFRAAIARVTHQHDTDTERHVTNVRESRANEGDRPDFTRVESVQRVLADYAQLTIDIAKLPDVLSDGSKSMIAYAANRADPAHQYCRTLNHEHGFSDDELAQFFEAQT